MIYSGKAITVQATDDGIAELCFDLQDESVNKFNAQTLDELREATAAIAADKSVKGVIVTSGKPVFIVGADIMEFGALFGGAEDAVAEKILGINTTIFNAFMVFTSTFGQHVVSGVRCPSLGSHLRLKLHRTEHVSVPGDVFHDPGRVVDVGRQPSPEGVDALLDILRRGVARVRP